MKEIQEEAVAAVEKANVSATRQRRECSCLFREKCGSVRDERMGNGAKRGRKLGKWGRK